MSVVLHRSAGKMIFRGLVAVVLSFAWIKSVTGATSYSNVYMQSGPGFAYYGPAALRSAQLAPIAAAPLMSSVMPPCISPCVLPNQRIAALAPVATSSSNFVPYNPPVSVPVVVAPTDNEPTSYEYSYVVYDEDTGDQKAQKETSDGSVVRGQYSLIQPDGYVREVQYTADDIRGFNAIVKNFLPAGEAKEIPPCPENKKESLKEGESQEKAHEAEDLEPAAESHEEQGHKEEGHEENNEPKPEKHSHEKNKSHEEHESHEEHAPEKHGGHEEHKSHESHESHEKHAPEEHGSHEEHESHEEHGDNEKPESHEEHRESEEHEEPANSEGHEHETPEEHARHGAQAEAAPEEHGEPESHGESHEEEHGSERKMEGEPVAVLPADINALVSYNDLIKCIQSAMKVGKIPQQSVSPLTYIILNKPC